MYYSIGEVAEILGENTSLVRFWSNSFPAFIKPERNAKGNRKFTPEDLETLKQIHLLVKGNGMTLEGAAKKLRESRRTVDSKTKAIDSLKEIPYDQCNDFGDRGFHQPHNMICPCKIRRRSQQEADTDDTCAGQMYFLFHCFHKKSPQAIAKVCASWKLYEHSNGFRANECSHNSISHRVSQEPETLHPVRSSDLRIHHRLISQRYCVRDQTLKRYPTPQIVSIYCGFDVSNSIFSRIFLMCTVTVAISPIDSIFQIWRKSSSLE